MRLLLPMLLLCTPVIADQANSSAENKKGRNGAITPVEGADLSTLASDLFMRYQAIKLAGDGCSSNSRFLLYDDGRLFMQHNSAKDDCASRPADTRFNKPFDSKPTKILHAAQLKAIRKALVEYGFEKLPGSISPDGKVFDGSMQIMEVRTGKNIKRVISVQSASKPVEEILEVIWAQIY